MWYSIVEEREREGKTIRTDPQKRTICAPMPKGLVCLLTPYVPRHLNVPLYAKIMKITNSLVPNVRTRFARAAYECHARRNLCPHARPFWTLGNYRALCQWRYISRKQTVTWNTFLGNRQNCLYILQDRLLLSRSVAHQEFESRISFKEQIKAILILLLW